MEEVIDIFISASITVFSLGLLLISIASYRRFKNIKLLFISLVFFVFLINGILLSLYVFTDIQIGVSPDPYFGVFNLIMLLL